MPREEEEPPEARKVFAREAGIKTWNPEGSLLNLELDLEDITEFIRVEKLHPRKPG